MLSGMRLRVLSFSSHFTAFFSFVLQNWFSFLGHVNWWQLGVYHQNIRPANIRFGNLKPGSEAGNRGILVGFGRATETTRPNGTLSMRSSDR